MVQHSLHVENSKFHLGVCPKWLYLTHVTSYSFHKKNVTSPQDHFQAEK